MTAFWELYSHRYQTLKHSMTTSNDASNENIENKKYSLEVIKTVIAALAIAAPLCTLIFVVKEHKIKETQLKLDERKQESFMTLYELRDKYKLNKF